MGRPAARQGDNHTCPQVTPGVPPVPHVGGPITAGCTNILIGGQAAATVGKPCTCVGPPDVVQTGSPTVLFNNLFAARLTDMTAHGGLIASGFPTVLIGVDPVLEAIIAGVNPTDSVINCGHLVDAAIARLNGTDPNATAPAGQDGSFEEIGNRHGTTINFGSSFEDAFEAVRSGGDGTTAIVGIIYGSGNAHVVTMTNRDGNVSILEGQDWGDADSREVITNPARANERYNSDGRSDVGYGITP